MKEMRGMFLGLLMATVGFVALGKSDPVVTAMVRDEDVRRPVIEMTVGHWSYLFCVELAPRLGRYTQKVTMQVSDVGFEQRTVLLASDAYAPVIDETQNEKCEGHE